MISVVVCSINKELASRLENNISETIGVPFEMIVLDNTVQKQSINYIYNQGAGKAKFDILCFLHEDILINTPGWGEILFNLFEQDPKLGLIALAGAKYKSKTNSGWYTNVKEFDCCAITHLDASGHEKKVYLNPQPGSPWQQVVVVDGVFMSSRKAVWSECKFDAGLLKGFHFYDIDYSFRVSQKYRSIVTYAIDVTHITEGGDFGNNWIYHSKLWHDTYAAMLPFSCLKLEDTAVKKYELTIANTWLNLLMKQKVFFKKRMHWLRILGASFLIRLPMSAAKFIIYDLLKRAKVINERPKRFQ